MSIEYLKKLPENMYINPPSKDGSTASREARNIYIQRPAKSTSPSFEG